MTSPADYVMDHVAITGRVYASKGLCRCIKAAQWKLNIFYNATIDAGRDFTECVEHSLAWMAARDAGEKSPERPPETGSFRPLGDGKNLGKKIAELLSRHPELAGLPFAAYMNAVSEGERARKRLVKNLATMEPGARPPRLSFRSMRQCATIKTQAYRLYERRGPNWVPTCWPQHRSDSPKATRGRDKVKLEIQGLPRLNARLSRPIPADAIVKQIVLSMDPDHGKVRVSLICEVPTRNQDQLAHDRAWATHAILRDMPEGLPAQDALAWARERGIRIRGDDLGIDAPSADDRGYAERRVAPLAEHIRAVAEMQRRLSHKDEMALAALPTEQQALVIAGKAKPPERSKTAKRLKAQIARHGRTMRNRSKTAACTRARRMVKAVDIIATDPPEMAARLIRKGGPAERRAKSAPSTKEALVSAEARRPSDWMMSPAQRRSMRRNMAATGGGFRIRRVAVLARQSGVLHITPGNAGTSSECPKCAAPKDNALSARRHLCACGCDMPRDQASAQVTAARALYALRASPDPGDVRATREGAETASRQKSSKRKAAMAAGRAKARNRGRSEPHTGRPIPGHKHQGGRITVQAA